MLFRSRAAARPTDLEQSANHRGFSERTKGTNGTDRTKYGSARNSPRAYYVHHTQQLSKAAVMYDAMAIRKQIIRACGSASALRLGLHTRPPPAMRAGLSACRRCPCDHARAVRGSWTRVERTCGWLSGSDRGVAVENFL